MIQIFSPRLVVTALTLFPSRLVASFSSNLKMSFSTHRDNNGLITITPKNEGGQSGLVVICHGLGDSAEGFVDVAEHLAKKMPHVKFILPTAPTQPVTMNMGMAMASWYDIVGLDERSNENCKGIESSVSTLSNILKTEHDTTGLPYHRMVLAGFSQGGALSLFTGMQLPVAKKLAGIVVMSGYLPCAQSFKISPGLEDTPILHCHGTADPMVRHDMALKSQKKVQEGGSIKYEIKSYDGMQHTVIPEEITFVQTFLESILSVDVDESCRVKLKNPSDMSMKELRATIVRAGLTHKSVGMMEKSEFVNLVKNHREGK